MPGSVLSIAGRNFHYPMNFPKGVLWQPLSLVRLIFGRVADVADRGGTGSNLNRRIDAQRVGLL